MTKFTQEDFEYFYIIVHLMENILDLGKKVTLTTDKKFFNKYVTNPRFDKTDLGACIRETGMVWLNEKELVSETRALTTAVIIHEMLHIKYPLKTEPWISKAD